MANIITGSRILCGLILLWFPTFSLPFYVCTALGGLSDAVDGILARKRKEVSSFGAKLDTVADLVFFACVWGKIIAADVLPRFVLIGAGVIAFVKVINVISGFVVQGHFPAVHTAANKICGVLLFLLPFGLNGLPDGAEKGIWIGMLALAGFAAVQEGHFIRTGRIVE